MENLYQNLVLFVQRYQTLVTLARTPAPNEEKLLRFHENVDALREEIPPLLKALEDDFRERLGFSKKAEARETKPER
jgi:hypothetical protein